MAGPTLRLNIDSTGAKQGADQFTNATKNIANSATQAGTAVDKMGGRFSKFTNMSAQSRFVFQNTANQLGDIAVQASMGTNMFRVLGMQLPQLAGGFAVMGGALGTVAPILGVIAAIGFPIIAAFTSMGGAAETTADRLDDLADKLDRAKELQRQALTSVSELATEYGSLAIHVRDSAFAFAEFDLYKTLQDARTLRAELTETFTKTVTLGTNALGLLQDNAQAFKDLGITDTQEVNNLINLMDQFGVGLDSAIRLRDAVVAMNEASTDEEMSAAMLRFSQEVLKAGMSSENMSDELVNAARSSRSLGEMIAVALGLMEKLETSATGVSSALHSAVTQGNFTNFLPLRGEEALMNMPVTQDTDAARKARAAGRKAERDRQAAARQAASARRKEQTELANFAKRFKPLIDATTEYNQNMEKLNRAREIGAITEAQHAQATAVATQQYQIATGEAIDYTSAANALANSLTDSLMMLADGTSSVKDAFKSMAQAVIKELYRVLVVQQLVNAVMGAFGFSPSMGGGYVPTGGAGAYGGPVEAGKGIVVGERGPEVFYPAMNGTLQPNGGGDVIVNQTINVSTGVQQTVRTEIRSLMPEIANSAKSAVVDAKRRGGGYGRAFA